jgi:hypothetical protein
MDDPADVTSFLHRFLVGGQAVAGT